MENMQKIEVKTVDQNVPTSGPDFVPLDDGVNDCTFCGDLEDCTNVDICCSDVDICCPGADLLTSVFESCSSLLECFGTCCESLASLGDCNC